MTFMDRAKAIGATALGGALVLGALWIVPGLVTENHTEARVGAPASRATPVVTRAVTLEPQQLRLEAVGTSRAIRSVTLFPEAAGEVVSVGFEAGQRVAAGDLLLALDSRDEKLALELAEVRVADAERLWRRYQRARDTDAVPINDREAAETALAAARIELQRAQVALDDRFVRAPFDGVVGLTDVETGDRIDPSVPITTLDDRSALLVDFEVPELMLGALRTGEPIEVATWDRREATASGELTELGSRIDPVTRTVAARARVTNEDDRLRPGMSFRVTLRTEGNRYPVVPEVSLQWGVDGAFVWTVAEGRAQRVGADIVQRIEGAVLIDAELDAGDPVVVEGVQSMREGREVEPTPPRQP
jgi:RND family efflux transporter MFP subunit